MRRPPNVVTALAVVSLLSRSGAAQDLSGSWRSTRDDVDVTVSEWGTACGPRPSSRHGSTGREATVRASGSDLGVDIGGRTLRTGRCWSDNRDVSVRTSAHPSPSRWVTTCSTAEGAALAERATYTVSAEGDRRLVLRDETDYQWNLQGSVCRASSVAVREYERVGAAPPPTPDAGPPAPTPTPTPAPRPPVVPAPRRCVTVGAPAALVITPARRSLPVGGRGCFRARVVDAARCDIEGAAVEWRARATAGSASVTVDRGCVALAGGEGTVEVVATAGALTARAAVTVVSEDQFRSLAAAHIEEEDASVESDAPGGGQSLGVAVSTEPSARRSPWLAVVLGGAGLVLAAVLVGWLLARRRKAAAADRWSDPSPPPTAPPPPRPVPEPAHRSRREAPPVEVLPPAAPPRPEPVAPPVAFTRRCPSCNKLFGDGSDFCTEDGSRLVLLSSGAPVGHPAPSPPQLVRVCPRCARRYEPPMDFCVDDGERLRDG